MLKQVLAGLIALICIIQAVVNFDSVAMAGWIVAAAGWIPHMLDDKLRKVL